MKKAIILAVFLSFGLAAALWPAEFGYPIGGEAWYFIKVHFSNTPPVGEGQWRLAQVLVNEERVRDFVVFQSGKETTSPEVNGLLPFDLKIRYAWQGKKNYSVQLRAENTKTGKIQSLQAEVQSPAKKGYWDPAWKNYLSLVISEDHGYERTHYPVHATFGVLSRYLGSPQEIRVVSAELKATDVSYADVPHQVYDVVKWDDQKLLATVEKDEKTGERIIRYHPTTTVSVAFITNIKPRQKLTYIIFYNNPKAKKPSFKTDLKVTGKGLAKVIENSHYKAVLHEKSGMLHEITEKTKNIKLEHKLETNGALHWNPDAYSPPHAWVHCSDWENPRYSEETGPIFYSLRREAPLPYLKDIVISVTYYFYAGSPFIFSESVMEVKKDMFLKAIRSAEVVFNKAVFEKVAYKTFSGKVNTIDLATSKMHPAHVAVLRYDTPWITLFSDQKGIGFANLYLDLAFPNIHGGSASLQQPYLYIQHGPWYYISRAFVYSFGSNNQTRMLPVKAGSLYYDRIAWIAFPCQGKSAFGPTIDRHYNMLKYPLEILEDIETYAESPEGWLVPILTEPFEEGVKEAVGGKKR